MNIYDATAIRSADQFTIQQEGISSADLMERASLEVSRICLERYTHDAKWAIICGNGNNGGDGLCVARHFASIGKEVRVIWTELTQHHSPDFTINLEKLEQQGITAIKFSGEPISLDGVDVVIDALLGSGISRPPDGRAAELISIINACSRPVISIDLPSGMMVASPTPGPCVHASLTVSFEWPKPAFFMPENEEYLQEWLIVPIGLNHQFPGSERLYAQTIEVSTIREFWKERPKFGHKGLFGHACLLAGSKDMPGAGHLCAYACLRAGAGLVTLADNHEEITRDEVMHLDRGQLAMRISQNQFHAMAMGPGLGTDKQAIKDVTNCLTAFRSPVVIDADALNILAAHHDLAKLISPHSILTPHPGEFRRLAGGSSHSFEQLDQQVALSKEWNCIIILKRAHTCITTPAGDIFFNTTGNPGMATAGSGDVLTGIITAFLAQGYSPIESALAGVFLHGFVGRPGHAGTWWNQHHSR
jgi:hydroxyethylthiazole kinase-like uncharacterized protein yjeF